MLITVSQNILFFTTYFEFQIFIGFNGVRKVVSCDNFGERRVVCVICQYNIRIGIELTVEGTVIMIIKVS
jgi:hypothetical protein